MHSPQPYPRRPGHPRPGSRAKAGQDLAWNPAQYSVVASGAKRPAKLCPPERSEAEWGDLVFQLSATTINSFLPRTQSHHANIPSSICTNICSTNRPPVSVDII